PRIDPFLLRRRSRLRKLLAFPGADRTAGCGPSRPRRRRRHEQYGIGRGAGGAHLTFFQPADIGDLVDVGDPRVSPDGRSIAYVVTCVWLDDNDYRQKIFVTPADGSAQPVAISADGSRCSKPRWSPDGRRLAFVRSDEPERG